MEEQKQVEIQTNGTQDKPEDKQQPEGEQQAKKMEQMKDKSIEMKIMPTKSEDSRCETTDSIWKLKLGLNLTSNRSKVTNSSYV